MPDSTIEYFYSVRSSFTYLGAARLNALAERRGLTIRHHPIHLGVVISAFDRIEGQQPADRPHAGARVYEDRLGLSGGGDHGSAGRRPTRILTRRNQCSLE